MTVPDGIEDVFGYLDALKAEKALQPSRSDSVKRAKDKALEIAFGNRFKYFVTLTLNKEKVDRYSSVDVGKLFRKWLNNQVNRNGLQYLFFPEYHADGAIHFHGLISGDLHLKDSQTLIVKGYDKPIKVSTANRRNLSGIKVYNVDEWHFGYSTAISLYGDYSAAVYYCMKYITKDSKKIFGNFYYAGGHIERAVPCDYGIVNFENVKAETVSLPFTTMKFKYVVENSSMQTDCGLWNEIFSNYERLFL